MKLQVRWLGRVTYEKAFALQETLVEEIERCRHPGDRSDRGGQPLLGKADRCGHPGGVQESSRGLSGSDTPGIANKPLTPEGSQKNGGADGILLLLEHEPVYTIGRTPDQSSLRGAAHLPFPVVQINRGGQATYHGPGQLVGYPILDLKERGQDLHRYMRELEGVLIDVLAEFGIAAGRRAGLTGVWVGPRKIASIGVGVRHWISMHGFALNVCGDLTPFSQITPCGIAGVEMTNIERETGQPSDVAAVANRVAAVFERRFA